MKYGNIDGISFSRLQNVEHLALVKKLLATLKKYGETFTNMQKYIERLEAFILSEENAYKTSNSSTFTEEKAKADTIRDNAARQLKRHVYAYEVSDNPQEADAARMLSLLLSEVSNMIEESNETKTVDFNSLVSRMREVPFLAAVKELGAEKLVEKLYEKNKAYNEISIRQTETDSVGIGNRVSNERKPVDEELHRMFRIIQNRFDTETADNNVKSCVNELNYDIREAIAKMKQRVNRGKKMNAAAADLKSEPVVENEDIDIEESETSETEIVSDTYNPDSGR